VSLRFRTRAVHATLVDEVKHSLESLGWITPPINFGLDPITVVDYQPDERGERIATNTVAITLGDVPVDEDEELGAAVGGLRSVDFPVFFDIYMAEQPLSIAVADDLVAYFTDNALAVKDVVNDTIADGVSLVIEDVAGPRRPPAAAAGEAFKKHWRVVELTAVLYFNT
jgi:hypothetical protein